MADELISFSFDTSAFDAMTVEIKDPTRRATQYALRAVGRKVAAAAKTLAPVYNGTSDPRALAERGNLKKSIANAKRIKGDGEAFELKVGPFGTKRKGTEIRRTRARSAGGGSGEVRGVPMYRSKMEAKYHFMEAGTALAGTIAHETFDAAYSKAWAKWTS